MKEVLVLASPDVLAGAVEAAVAGQQAGSRASMKAGGDDLALRLHVLVLCALCHGTAHCGLGLAVSSATHTI